jgi:outer membrane protein assembly factor BamE (lipoprotein component of BamABCDE complex)
MKRLSIISIILFSLSVLLGGCAAKTGNAFLEKASDSDISSKLIKNKTTKEQVKNTFGDPIDIDFRDGKEVWVYKFTRASSKAINFVPIAGSFYGGTNDNTKTLKILFNDDIVEQYAFSSSKGETKAGLFQ